MKRFLLRNWQNTPNPKLEGEGFGGEKHTHELVLPFGLSYQAPAGSTIIVIGDADDSIAVVAGSKTRPEAPEGGVVLYSAKSGHTLTLSPDGMTRVDVGGSFFEITETGVRSNLDIETTGDVKAGGVSLKEHVHSGVMSGGSSTGKPQ